MAGEGSGPGSLDGPPPFDTVELTRWWEAAGDAAGAARLLAQGGHNQACFSFEQAAQLALKGLLHGMAVHAWGHDLVALGGRCATELGDSWPPDMQDMLVELARHYIPARYPDAHVSGTPAQHYRAQDSEAAARQADRVLATVWDVWASLTGGDQD